MIAGVCIEEAVMESLFDQALVQKMSDSIAEAVARSECDWIASQVAASQVGLSTTCEADQCEQGCKTSCPSGCSSSCTNYNSQ